MRKTTFDEMLTHLLILDTMLVIFFLVDAMTTIVFESSPDWYKVLYPFVIHPGKTISMSATVFMVVAVSADRQRAICHPMLYRVRNLKPTLESGINVPLHLLIFGIFSRGYSLITNLKDLNFTT